MKLSKPGWEVDGVDGAAVEQRPNFLNCSPPVLQPGPVGSEAVQEGLPDQPGQRPLGPAPHQAAGQSGHISQEQQQASLRQPGQTGRS